MNDRVQKILGRAGIASRREIERWIEAGRVTINGHRASLGARIAAGDRIYIDGRRLKAEIFQTPTVRCLLYNKPVGLLCSRSDPNGRGTIFDRLPRLQSARWISVGRLDINTAGLLILTTDGLLAHRLMHPSFMVDREYMVRIQGELDVETQRLLRTGVMLDDGTARFKELQLAGGQGSNHWYRVVVDEGRNRLVRRVLESQGVRVNRLLRTRYGKLSLPRQLATGRWRELDSRQTAGLFEHVGLRPPS